MKTIVQLKKQKAILFLDLACRRTDGKISREYQEAKCRKIHAAYDSAYRRIISQLFHISKNKQL